MLTIGPHEQGHQQPNPATVHVFQARENENDPAGAFGGSVVIGGGEDILGCASVRE
jgi:hypothetical protein